jgi:hypothetical protein
MLAPGRIAVPLALVALLVPGCGGDDAEEVTTEDTQVTIPEELERDRTEATPIVEEPVAPVPETTPPPPPPEPEPAPPPEPVAPAPDPAKPDSPRNDTPPPSGSPAESFEQYCKENPRACS